MRDRAPLDPTRCCHYLYRPGMSWSNPGEQCSRKWTVEEGGKHYCKQHAPSTAAAKTKARNEKWDAEARASSARWAREEYDRLAGDVCRALGWTLDDLKAKKGGA